MWQIFPTQEMAFKFADAHDVQNADADRLAVLTFEDSATGRRRFLVTTLDVFWQRSASQWLAGLLARAACQVPAPDWILQLTLKTATRGRCNADKLLALADTEVAGSQLAQITIATGTSACCQAINTTTRLYERWGFQAL